MWFVTAIWSPRTKGVFAVATNKMEPKLELSLDGLLRRNKP
jgi:hypothetical protein